MAIVKTLTFSDDNNGWTSFWDYEPSFAFSVRGHFFTTKDGVVYKHYDEAKSPQGRGYYYGTYYPSEITIVFNDDIGVSKNFKTIVYDGSNGWEASSILSDEQFPTSNGYSPISVKDQSERIESFSEGRYLDSGVEYRSGFDLKENKYYGNINNNGTTLREGQVIEGGDLSGIKGMFISVTMKTDQTTRVGGEKQLFSVSTEYNKSFY